RDRSPDLVPRARGRNWRSDLRNLRPDRRGAGPRAGRVPRDSGKGRPPATLAATREGSPVRRRKVAIVGGGAAGLVCAWLLDEICDVTVFEKAPVLGGHVRTLGGNLPAVPGAPTLDAGVLLFEKRNFPTVHTLFDLLGVRPRPVMGAPALHHGGLPAPTPP